MQLELLSQCLVCGGNSVDVVDRECNISRCTGCGYVFDNPRPALEEIIKFYSRSSQYDSWLRELDERRRMWRRRLGIVLRFRKKGTLLDVGTGIGQFLALARPYYDEVFGTEVSPVAIKLGWQRFSLDLTQTTLETFADGDKRFDNISLFHVLEHVPNPASLLETCHSLLSERGALVIAVPNEVASLRASLKRALVRLNILRPRPGVGRFGLPVIKLEDDTQEIHLSHFTPRVLKFLLERSGFLIRKETLDPHYVRNSLTARLRADIYYLFCLVIRKLLGMNVYDSLLVIAHKNDHTIVPQPRGKL